MFPRASRLLVPALCACSLAAAQVAPPSSSPPAAQATAPSLRVAAAQQQALGILTAPVRALSALSLSATGRVVPALRSQQVVAAPFAGVVTRLRVAPGDAVRAGQALADFHSPEVFEARRSLDEARSQSALAESALRRDQALQAEGIIPAARLQVAQARAAEARAALQARQQAVTSTGLAGPALVAPADGTVLELGAVAGQRLAAGEVLARLARDSQLELEASLPPGSAPPRAGDAVAVPAHGAAGRVAGVVPALDGSGTLRVRATVTQAGRLRPGMSVPLQIALRDTAPTDAGALFELPARALLQWQGHAAVFVAAGEQFTLVPVQAVSADEERAVVRSTLAAGARVASGGVAALKGLLAGGE